MSGDMAPDECLPARRPDRARPRVRARGERRAPRPEAGQHLPRPRRRRAVLVKLLDFGIARATHTQRMASPFSTGEGIVFGTPGYMSPEQACGSKLDARVDLWALATVAYEALTGELPLRGTYTSRAAQEPPRRRDRSDSQSQRARFPPASPSSSGAHSTARIEHRFAGASELASSFDQAIATPSGGAGGRHRCPPLAGSVAIRCRWRWSRRRLRGPSRPRRRAWPGSPGLRLVLVAMRRDACAPDAVGPPRAHCASSVVERGRVDPGLPSAFALPRARSLPSPARLRDAGIVPPLPHRLAILSESSHSCGRRTRFARRRPEPRSPQTSGLPAPSSYRPGSRLPSPPRAARRSTRAQHSEPTFSVGPDAARSRRTRRVLPWGLRIAMTAARDFSTISPSARSLLMVKAQTSLPFARQAAELSGVRAPWRRRSARRSQRPGP